MLEPYYNINKAVGVSITLFKNGDHELNICQISVDNKQLNIEKSINSLTSVDELNKHIPTKSHIALNISGKGILQKQIDVISEIDQNNFNQILPNAKFDDFYIQNFISGDQSFVSVIRKSEADKWIDSLNKPGLNTVLLSLGAFPVDNIQAQLNVYDNQVIFNGHNFSRTEQHTWLSYKYYETASSPYPLKIESEPINEKLVVAYANAFQLVLSDKITQIKAHVPVLTTALQNLLDEKKFKVRGFILLISFFILLLINFIVLSYLNNSNTKLNTQASQSAQSINNVQEVDEQVKIKEAILKDLGWDNGINKARLIDQIAALLPTDVSWSTLTINPIDQNASRFQKSLNFIDRRIRVAGTAQKIIPVNEWIARIKTQKWVKSVELESYTYNNELNTGQFVIIINY